jgi:hypothetical protein
MKKSSAWVFVITSFLVSVVLNANAAQVTFTPRASVTEEYNDNIDLDRTDEEDDFITTVAAGFTAEITGQTRFFRLSYDPSYSFFADNDENDGFQHIAQALFRNEFSRSTNLELFNYFIYSQDPLSDENVVDDSGNVVVPGDDTRSERDTYYRNNATVRLNHRFGINNTAYAQFVHSYLDNDDPDEEDSQEFRPSLGLFYWFTSWTGVDFVTDYTKGLYDDTSSDFDEIQGRLRLNHRISQRFGLYGEYRHIYRDYDEPGTNFGGNDQNDYMVYAPSAGLFYDFGDNLTASFGVGYYYQQIENFDDEQGPFINTDVNKAWRTGRWDVRLRGESGIDSQDFTTENLGFERFAEIALTPRYYFTRQFFTDANFRYRYSDFINSEDDRVDHRYSAMVGLGYNPLRWMTVRLEYNFDKLDSENTLEDYDVNRVFLSVTLQADPPWRIK